MSLVFTRLAQAEMDEARRYYNRQQRGLGDEFMREARLAVRRILAQPLAWQVDVEPVRRFILHRFPCKLLYAIRGDRIVVLGVAHLHRNPDYWVDRIAP